MESDFRVSLLTVSLIGIEFVAGKVLVVLEELEKIDRLEGFQLMDYSVAIKLPIQESKKCIAY